MKKKLSVFVLATIIVVGFSLVVLFHYLAGMQKDTCKKSIEFSLVLAINQKIITLKTALNTEWKQLDSTEREQLLEYMAKNTSNYTECLDYSHLTMGKELDGTDLPIFARKDILNNIEMLLGHNR